MQLPLHPSTAIVILFSEMFHESSVQSPATAFYVS